MPLAIEAHDLTKRFPPTRGLRDAVRLLPPWRNREDASTLRGTLAVDRVTFNVREGEIFGLVGPNGAGKTTLVKMLSTLILPNAGWATVNGHALAHANEVKASIGLMTCNERSFYPRLTCRDNLRFYAGLYHLTASQCDRKTAELAAMLDMDGFLDKRYDRCSTGMKHRLALARALLNDASLLFLDEPTTALDPVAAAQFRERLYSLVHRETRTVFLVTHNLDEAVELCDNVAVMLQGRLHMAGAPERLRSLLQSDAQCDLRVRDFSPSLVDRLRALDEVSAVSVRSSAQDMEGAGDVVHLDLRLGDRKRALPAVVAAVDAGGASLEGLDLPTASWEDVAQRLSTMRETPADPSPAPGRISDTTPQHATLPADGALAPEDGVVRQQGRSRQTAARYRELMRTLPLFLKRDLQMQLSYRLSFVLQFLGILFSIASFYFVGEVFGMQASPYLDSYGGDYFSFVLIGIALSGYQSVALYAFSGVIQSAQSTGTLEAMLTTPTRLSTILVGSSMWNFVFTSFRVLLYLIAGVLFFGARFGEANLLAALVILALTITSLGGIGILSASFIMVFKRGNPINFLLGSFSTLLGGVYYPVEVLPRWLQILARFYPLTYSLQAMRRALLTGASFRALAHELGVLFAFSIVLLPLGLVAFRYAVQQAKRDGSLTQF